MFQNVTSGSTAHSHLPHHTSDGCPVFLKPSGKLYFYIPFALISLGTSVTNCIIITIFIRFREIRQHNNNLLILSMCVADFLVGAGAITSGAMLMTKGRELVSTNKPYVIIPFSTFATVSGFTLILMTADRFVAITYPLRYNVLVSRKRLGSLVLLSWALPCVAGVVNTLLDKYQSSPEYLYTTFVTTTWLTFFILFTSNLTLFNASRKLRASTANVPATDSPIIDTIKQSRAESNATVITTASSSYGPTNVSTSNISTDSQHSSRITDISNDRRCSLVESKMTQPFPPLRERASTTTCFEGTKTTAEITNEQQSLSNFNLGVLREILTVPPNLAKLFRGPKTRPISMLTSYMCFVFSSMYSLCMLPASVHVTGILCGLWCPSTFGFQLFATLVLFNSFINPFLYFFKRKNCRKYLKLFFQKNKGPD